MWKIAIKTTCVCVQYIENLDRLRHLEVLNLSKNDIERIEKLDKLICLRELNLSFNCIAKIERLETLTSLQVLNLSGNKIDTIPLWLSKKLKALRAFKIARNHIQSVSRFLVSFCRLNYLPTCLMLFSIMNELFLSLVR